MKKNCMNKLFKILTLLMLAGSLSACSSIAKQWKSIISDENQAPVAANGAAPQPTNFTYSNQENLAPPVYRDYQRMTKKEFENQARVDSRAGSLWVMEGQGSYLFAQNVVRMIGDPVNISLEGEPRNQLERKAEVINDLLKELDLRRKALSRNLASNGQPQPAQAPNAAPAPNQQQNLLANNEQNQQETPGILSVKNVPTRITERLVDGNYRVQGMQPFMIGGREYKVIVSGIVKSEDFNENGISAQDLLDPSFDIVSSKSTEM